MSGIKRVGRMIDAGFTWALTAFVVINGAIAITALVAAVLSRGDFVSPLLWRCAGWAILGGLYLSLERENRRLKNTPLWLAADRAWADGYAAGQRAATVAESGQEARDA